MAMKSDSGSVAGGRRAHLDPIQPGGGSGVAEFCPAGGRRHPARRVCKPCRSSDPGFSTQRVHHHRASTWLPPVTMPGAHPQFSGSTGGSPAIAWAESSRRPGRASLRSATRIYSSSPVAVDGFVAQPGEQPVDRILRNRSRHGLRLWAFRWSRAASSRAADNETAAIGRRRE